MKELIKMNYYSYSVYAEVAQLVRAPELLSFAERKAFSKKKQGIGVTHKNLLEKKRNKWLK